MAHSCVSDPRRGASDNAVERGYRRELMNENTDEITRITYPYDFFLQNRVATVASLFAADAYSIDAIILAGTVLTALAFRRYRQRGPGADQENFERLMLEHWPAYVDRVSIPEILRHLELSAGVRRDQGLLNEIRKSFVVDLPYGQIRRVAHDPSRIDWNNWLTDNGLTFEGSGWFSYARIVFRDFRNSVQHRLDIARGREAHRLGFDEPFFYANYNGLVRFGFHHPRFEDALRDVVASLRAWAVAESRDIFHR